MHSLPIFIIFDIILYDMKVPFIVSCPLSAWCINACLNKGQGCIHAWWWPRAECIKPIYAVLAVIILCPNHCCLQRGSGRHGLWVRQQGWRMNDSLKSLRDLRRRSVLTRSGRIQWVSDLLTRCVVISYPTWETVNYVVSYIKAI